MLLGPLICARLMGKYMWDKPNIVDNAFKAYTKEE